MTHANRTRLQLAYDGVTAAYIRDISERRGDGRRPAGRTRTNHSSARSRAVAPRRA